MSEERQVIRLEDDITVLCEEHAMITPARVGGLYQWATEILGARAQKLRECGELGAKVDALEEALAEERVDHKLTIEASQEYYAALSLIDVILGGDYTGDPEQLSGTARKAWEQARRVTELERERDNAVEDAMVACESGDPLLLRGWTQIRDEWRDLAIKRDKERDNLKTELSAACENWDRWREQSQGQRAHIAELERELAERDATIVEVLGAMPGSDTDNVVQRAARVVAERDEARAEVDRLRFELEKPGGLTDRARAECMAYADEQRTRAAVAETALAAAEEEIDNWKHATGLLAGGGPDDVTPEQMRQEWDKDLESLAAAEATIGRVRNWEKDPWEQHPGTRMGSCLRRTALREILAAHPAADTQEENGFRLETKMMPVTTVQEDGSAMILGDPKDYPEAGHPFGRKLRNKDGEELVLKDGVWVPIKEK